MHLPIRDAIATCRVAAGLLYLLRAIGSALPGTRSSTRATRVAVLALGEKGGDHAN